MGREFDPRKFRPDEIRRVIEGLRTLSSLPHFNPEAAGEVLGDLHVALRQARERGLPSGNKLTRWWREWRERERENHQAEELKHLLTAEPSIISGTGWRIYHPLQEEQVTYRKKPNGHSQAVTFIPNTAGFTSLEYIKIGEMNTCITAQSENGSPGSNGVRLEIYKDDPENYGQVGYRSQSLEWYFLGGNSKPQDGIETGIVVFENTPENEIHYFQLHPSRSSDAVGLVEMERIPPQGVTPSV